MVEYKEKYLDHINYIEKLAKVEGSMYNHRLKIDTDHKEIFLTDLLYTINYFESDIKVDDVTRILKKQLKKSYTMLLLSNRLRINEASDLVKTLRMLSEVSEHLNKYKRN